MENIKAFNLITGDLFAKLYQNFPAYVEFDYFSLSTGLVSKDDYNLAWKMSDFAKATVDWLTDEGYIWIKPPQYGPMKT